MREDYTLLTPENVELQYEIAGVGSRVVAAAIDYTILTVGYFVLSLGAAFAVTLIGGLDGLVGGLEGLARRNDPRIAAALGFAIIGLVVILVFFGWWGYFVMFELLWNGQSPGKRMLGLRVVQTGGRPVTAVASLVRNLLRAIDLPLSLGVLVMLIDRSSRRLGDFAADTLVVREPRALGRAALAAVEIPEVPASEVEALPNAGRLTMAHYTLLRDYFARRGQLPEDRAEAVAASLADDLARALEVDPAEIDDPVVFLATAARAFEARHRYYDG